MQVREATLKANLSVQDFSQLFEKFMMWPLPVSFAQIKLTIVTLCFLMPCYSQFLRKYLGKYKISKYVSIADPEWKTFFKEFCSRQVAFVIVQCPQLSKIYYGTLFGLSNSIHIFKIKIPIYIHLVTAVSRSMKLLYHLV